jgi:hypothetical protein|tara:strand:- start:5455 stop:6342 length:888 start_codon:yes stop_codon:yes gene_type:complete
MASKILLKRSAISGQAPNTSHISTGELALNLPDGVLYGSNGTVIFEVGANTTTLNVGNGNATINGSGHAVLEGLAVNGYSFPSQVGTSGQIMQANATGHVEFKDNISAAVQVTNFTFSITSTKTLIEGTDDNSAVLSYTAGTEDVFLNGVKLVRTDDYAQTNSTAITLTANTVSGDVLEVRKVGVIGVNDPVDLAAPADIASSDTSLITLDSFTVGNYRSAKYLVTANTSDSWQSSEAIVLHDGTDGFITEYGSVYSNNTIYTLSADTNGGSVRLRATPVGAGTTFTFKKIVTRS